jgi:hypothetical protein
LPPRRFGSQAEETSSFAKLLYSNNIFFISGDRNANLYLAAAYGPVAKGKTDSKIKQRRKGLSSYWSDQADKLKEQKQEEKKS